ncbi:ice-binding family protein [Aridibaculum aurantiacum]|uniref:ice-binding family protein n=1 Tax=Aridibaculum aurantiacum TaxID=2810307 RepID=UPI001A97063C|nr:ice-binding family protein [Aridibaculum aurantiacum]
MKNKFLLPVVAVITLLSISSKTFAQVINLGTSANFVIFTTIGAIGNTNKSQLTGNVGTNNGGTTGFGNVNGVMHSGDGATASATNNLNSAYNQLNSAVPTATHAPLLGNGTTLTAGVYDISGVTTLSGILQLDAQGNQNAVFIFKISAAFSSTTGSEVKLINGALACNIFWKIEGAASLGSLSVMKGNVIAHNDFISVGSGANIEGRLLSINGAVTINNTTAKIPSGCGSVVLNGPTAPDLGSAICYALLSGNEDVHNTGTTTVKGDIGTNVGLTTGYDALRVEGTIHPIPDNSTNAAAAALINARTYLNALTADIELLFPAQFGQGLVLTPHTYVLNGATSFVDTLFLDAEGNANAVFVIKIYGALSSGSFAAVSLINGTQARNVYWIVNGAITIGTNADLKGTFISNNGAVNLPTGVRLEGRAMTTNGALTTTSVTVNMTEGCTSLPLSLVSFSGKLQNSFALLDWKTENEQNTLQFDVEASTDGRNFIKTGTVDAAGNSTGSRSYSFVANTKSIAAPVAFYRLKMMDIDGRFSYSAIVAIQLKAKATVASLYPNPVKSTTTLVLVLEKNECITYTISDQSGRIVTTRQVALQAGHNSVQIDANALAVGMYTLSISGTSIKNYIQFIKQ